MRETGLSGLYGLSGLFGWGDGEDGLFGSFGLSRSSGGFPVRPMRQTREPRPERLPSGFESDPAGFRGRRFHELANGVEEGVNLSVMPTHFPFELCQLGPNALWLTASSRSFTNALIMAMFTEPRMRMDTSAGIVDKLLRQTGSSLGQSTYCRSTPPSLAAPRVCLATLFHDFATKRHAQSGLWPAYCATH